MRLASLLQKSTGKAFGKRGFSEGRILLEWPKIVGERVASYCVPQKLVRDRHGRGQAVLHVDVLPGFVLELQQMEPQLLQTISTYAGYRAVDRITLHQVFYLPQAEQIETITKPTDQQAAQAAEQTGDVADEHLRDALTRLGARIAQKEETLAKQDTDA